MLPCTVPITRKRYKSRGTGQSHDEKNGSRFPGSALIDKHIEKIAINDQWRNDSGRGISFVNKNKMPLKLFDELNTHPIESGTLRKPGTFARPHHRPRAALSITFNSAFSPQWRGRQTALPMLNGADKRRATTQRHPLTSTSESLYMKAIRYRSKRDPALFSTACVLCKYCSTL